MEAAEIIKGLRDKTGMTRKAFSDHLGIPVRTVEDWEKGTAGIHPASDCISVKV